MLSGFWKLTWVEIKVFVREPLGVVGSLVVPTIIYIVLGRALGDETGVSRAGVRDAPFNVAILAALLIAVGAVLSLVAIIAIYREGGILKRLRATPLAPLTILGAHVAVKLLFTSLAMGLLVIAGRRFFPGAMEVNLLAFTAALLVSTLSILSLGFILASLVPTARFAQPLGAVILYPMVAVSGVFFPVRGLPPLFRGATQLLPTTHAVALMNGVWNGAGWSAMWPHLGALAAIFAVCCAIATRVFRWE